MHLFKKRFLPELPVPNSPYGLCGRKATLNLNSEQWHRVQELCESRCGRPGLPVPNSPYGLCGRKATLHWNWGRRRAPRAWWPNLRQSTKRLGVLSLIVGILATGRIHTSSDSEPRGRGGGGGTRGWNGYRNKSQHSKLTQEKNILPPLLQGLEPTAFQSRVRAL